MEFLRFSFSYNQLYFLCCALAAICLFLMLVLFVVWTKKRKKSRREAYEKADRDFKFTLPDRENSFVRDRLKGDLQNADEAKKQSAAVLMKDLDLRLDYTRKTITKLKASPLTPADRLEVNRISKTVTFYALKNALSPIETRALNDCFSRLLKLCAKYAV